MRNVCSECGEKFVGVGFIHMKNVLNPNIKDFLICIPCKDKEEPTNDVILDDEQNWDTADVKPCPHGFVFFDQCEECYKTIVVPQELLSESIS